MTRVFGVKAYGWDWANEHGMDMAAAARRMRSQGVNLALAQNLIDPLPGSAVAQVPPAGAYDDREWTARLQDAGIRVYQSTSVFFAPQEFADNPGVRPVDQYGELFEPFSWYVGICPTDQSYLFRKRDLIANAVAETQADGVFLSFLRFPSFWELWLPDAPGFTGTKRADIREYCFCERCLASFESWSSEDLGGGTTAQRAATILNELRDKWTAWKCVVIADIALTLRRAVHRVAPDTDVMLNAFGLGSTDFDNAVEEVLGQRFSELDKAIDQYELMFYFQIQKRDPLTWIPQRVAEVRAQTDRPIYADLQAGPEYLDDIYAAGQRSDQITPQDWVNALRGVAASGADGVLVYSWRDLLADEARGGERIARIRDYLTGVFD